jgi:hypothetical protein
MKIRMTFCFLALVGALGGLGVAWHRLTRPETAVSSAHDIPPLEYFASSSSFSEIEQARAQLQALARRHLYELQLRQAELQRAAQTGEPRQRAQAATQLRQLAAELERALGEFRGTGEEPLLTTGLLILLASERAHARWLDVYLRLLYQRPTEPVVGRLAEEAVTAGRATGSLEEVMAALRHVTWIPLEFEGKQSVRAVLAGFTLTNRTSTPELPTPPNTSS